MSERLIQTLLALCLIFVPASSVFAQNPIPDIYSDTSIQSFSTTRVDHFPFNVWTTKAVFSGSSWGTNEKMSVYVNTSGPRYVLASQAINDWVSSALWPWWHEIRYVGANWAELDIEYDVCTSGGDMCRQRWNPYNYNLYNVALWGENRIVWTPVTDTWSSAELQAGFAHEFGHVLGRGEGYNPLGCGTTLPSTIMNGLGCDSYTVTSFDDSTNIDYWQDGEHEWYASNSVGSTYLEAWKDYAWNEGIVLKEWYYYDWGSNNYLNFHSTTGPVENSGSHQSVNQAYSSINMYPAYSINVASYGSVPNGTYIKLCTTPVMAGHYGTRNCSPGTYHSW